MNEGDISPIHAVYSREMITGLATISDNAEKKIDNPEEQIKHQKIYSMEKDCFSGIKASETLNDNEIKTYKVDTEKAIENCKLTNNIGEALDKVLERTLHDKARLK